MNAKILKTNQSIKISHRKEHNYNNSVLLLACKDNEIIELISARFYWTSARCYCCVWIHSKEKNIYTTGSGFASGYGYDKKSASYSEALTSAGIQLDEDISGVGDTAIDESMLAIGQALGGKNLKILNVYG